MSNLKYILFNQEVNWMNDEELDKLANWEKKHILETISPLHIEEEFFNKLNLNYESRYHIYT